MAPILTTERLRLDPLTPADAGALLAHWSEPEVYRYLWDGSAPDPGAAAEAVAISARLFREARVGLWCLRAHDDPALLGSAGFWYFHEPPELELLVSLSRPRWGTGTAREAAERLLAYAFDELAWPFVQTAADAPNARSLRLIKELGMEPAGERPGAFGAILVYRLRRDAWRRARGGTSPN